MVGRYVIDQLQEVREKVMLERMARDSLRRRFQQNLEPSINNLEQTVPLICSQV